MTYPLHSSDKLTPEALREHFIANDFTTLPAEEPSEYTGESAEIYNLVISCFDEKWNEIAKEMGAAHPRWCYSQDFPTETLRLRIQSIVADNIIRLMNDEKAFTNVFESMVIPQLENGQDGNEPLRNVMRLLMQTIDFENLFKTAKEFSCAEDFSGTSYQNYPKLDHERKWNHSRCKLKTVSLDEISVNTNTGSETVNIDEIAVSNLSALELLQSLDDTDKRIVQMKIEGYSQKEIAETLGMTQGAVSKRIAKLKK